MRIHHSLVTVALAMSASTCCPTLWLQVVKDNPSPWPAVRVPPVDKSPYTLPPGSPNRFDVLEHGKQTIDFPDYTDAPDPKADPVDVMKRALVATDQILAKYAHPGPVTCIPMRATAYCSVRNAVGAAAHCVGLTFSHKVSAAAAVHIAEYHSLILNPPTATAPDDEFQLASELPAELKLHDKAPVDVCYEPELGLSKTLLSFIEMSDIQLRDPSVTLSDRRISHRLDWFDALSSFEYDEDLASYNQYVTEAVFATINGIVNVTKTADDPRFVVHTGDSIDSGSVGELERFHTLIDRLRIPFFEVLGNHDVLVFGNLLPTKTHTSDKTCTSVASLLEEKTSSLFPAKICVDQLTSCPSCIGHEGELVAQTTHAATRRSFIKHLHHDIQDLVAELGGTTHDYCPDTYPSVKERPLSLEHGFDLGRDDRTGEDLGYYAFAYPLDGLDRKAVFIGLNSEDLPDFRGGIRGHLRHAQVEWFKRVLRCVESKKTGDLVFVLAHQPLSEIDVDAVDADPDPNLSVAKILESSPNVVAYLFGHNHWHSVCGDSRKGVCTKFWEVETASLIEFPQEGHVVRIKQVGGDIAFLEFTALRERLVSQDSELARYVTLGRRGAERDFCNTYREGAKGNSTDVRCSEDHRPYRTDGRDANARLFFRLPPVTP